MDISIDNSMFINFVVSFKNKLILSTVITNVHKTEQQYLIFTITAFFSF